MENDQQPKRLMIAKQFSLSAPQEMYREQYGENTY